jgi:bacterial leucyl aminopeptidase
MEDCLCQRRAKMTINQIVLLILCLLFSNMGFSATKWISLDSDAVKAINDSLGKSISATEVGKDIAIIEVDESKLLLISEIMHEKFNRCGGFIVHDDHKEAFENLDAIYVREHANKGIFADYTINQNELVQEAINNVDQDKIKSTIEKLSSFHNRYYKSKTGVESQAWLKSKWEDLTKGRDDASVDYFNHSDWPQPSVILTIKGNENPDEIVVIGGHADSIAGYWDRAHARAPGADDNASGIATVTEIIRVLVETSFRPAKTIMFMGYAAEEVGLLGSRAIARQFRSNNKTVVGVLQLDMTNFNGSDLDIVMMTDYTNRDQNAFLGTLIDEYIKVPWGYDKCGYGCSDHASWHNSGYPASIPFEAKMREMNRAIHTSRDTLEVSRNSAFHASNFAKLGLAYMIELDR